MISRFSLSDDVAPLLECPLIHAFHHVSCLVRLQSLQELVFIQGICDKLLLTGCKQKGTKFKMPSVAGFVIHQAFIPFKRIPLISNTLLCLPCLDLVGW